MITNREKFNQLSNKELAGILANAQDACYYCSYGDNTNCDCNSIQCENNILEWLNQESEG